MDLAVNEPLTEETADLRDLADSIGFMARLAQVLTSGLLARVPGGSLM